MNHSNKNKKFGRVKKQREALMSYMAVSLFKNERMITTVAKAKALRPFAEKLITKAKKDNLNSYRSIIASLKTEDQSVAKKIFNEFSKRYQDRQGGYIRIIKLGQRPSDDAPMAQIEFV